MTQSNRYKHFEVPNNDADVKPSFARSCVFSFSYLANPESTMNWIFQNTVTQSHIQAVQPTSGFTR